MPIRFCAIILVLVVAPVCCHGVVDGSAVELLTFLNDYEGPVAATICYKSMQLALDKLREARINVFSAFNIGLSPITGTCSMENGTNTVLEAVRLSSDRREVLPIALVSSCGMTKYTMPLLHHFGFSAVTTSPFDSKPSPRKSLYRNVYPMFRNENYDILVAITSFVEYHGWRRVAILSEASHEWNTRDKDLTHELESRNISLIAVEKYQLIQAANDSTPEPVSFAAALKELRMADARIIVIHSSLPFTLLCPLYNAGFYGEAFVFMFNLNAHASSLPDLSESSCGRENVGTVLESTILFGLTKPDEFNSSIPIYEEPDALGMTYSKFYDEMRLRIPNQISAADSRHLQTACYDLVVAFGFLLQDLYKSGALDLWPNNRSLLLAAIDEHIQNLRVKTLSRTIDFSKNSLLAADVDIIVHDSHVYFYQPELPSDVNKRLCLKPIFSFEDGLIFPGRRKLSWKQIPPAEAVFGLSRIPVFGEETVAVFWAFGYFGIFVNVIGSVYLILEMKRKLPVFMVPYRLKVSTPELKVALLTGGSLSIVYVLTMQEGDETPKLLTLKCTIGVALGFIGQTMSWAALLACLEFGLEMIAQNIGDPKQVRFRSVISRLDSLRQLAKAGRNHPYANRVKKPPAKPSKPATKRRRPSVSVSKLKSSKRAIMFPLVLALTSFRGAAVDRAWHRLRQHLLVTVFFISIGASVFMLIIFYPDQVEHTINPLKPSQPRPEDPQWKPQVLEAIPYTMGCRMSLRPLRVVVPFAIWGLLLALIIVRAFILALYLRHKILGLMATKGNNKNYTNLMSTCKATYSNALVAIACLTMSGVVRGPLLSSSFLSLFMSIGALLGSFTNFFMTFNTALMVYSKEKKIDCAI